MQLKQLTSKHKFVFNKNLGQNFLSDETLLEQIISDSNINKECSVLEIGAGGGTLTKKLAHHARKVVAYEIDTKLKPILDEMLNGLDNTTVVYKDFLKADLIDIDSQLGVYSVVANLPYYITTEIILRFLEQQTNATSLTLTLQKQAAERLCGLGEKRAINVLLDSVADCKITRTIKSEKFFPQPNVDSAVMHIVFDYNKYNIADREVFAKFVKAAFWMRRKTLANNVSAVFGLTKDQAQQLLKQCGLTENVRGDALNTEQFIDLASTYADIYI